MYKNSYMHRSGNRAISAMRIRNEYASQYGIQYYLIVEGESDEHFFENILDCGRCKVTNLKGKENVLEFIEEQNRCKRKGYLAIVDADFEHILGRTTVEENVLLTDVHDMETLILSSNPKVRRIYSEFTDNIVIKMYEENNNRLFIDAIMDAAYEIGLLKLAIIKNKYNINMKDLPYVDVVDKNFAVNLKELINRIKGRYTECEIFNDLEDVRKQKYDKFQLCCGHDITDIFALSMKSEEDGGLGYGKKRSVAKEEIERILRIIYEIEKFQKTQLYKSILEWEEKNNIKIIDESLFSVA